MAYDASLGAEEKMGSLFQPDILVPTQYFEAFRTKTDLDPEELWRDSRCKFRRGEFRCP